MRSTGTPAQGTDQYGVFALADDSGGALWAGTKRHQVLGEYSGDIELDQDTGVEKKNKRRSALTISDQLAPVRNRWALKGGSLRLPGQCDEATGLQIRRCNPLH